MLVIVKAREHREAVRGSKRSGSIPTAIREPTKTQDSG